jgi:hypothetical protein
MALSNRRNPLGLTSTRQFLVSQNPAVNPGLIFFTKASVCFRSSDRFNFSADNGKIFNLKNAQA